MMLTFPSCYCETNFNMKTSSEQDLLVLLLGMEGFYACSMLWNAIIDNCCNCIYAQCAVELSPAISVQNTTHH